MTVTTPTGDTYTVEITTREFEDWEYKGAFKPRREYFTYTAHVATIRFMNTGYAKGEYVATVARRNRAHLADEIKAAIKNDQHERHPIEQTVIEVTV